MRTGPESHAETGAVLLPRVDRGTERPGDSMISTGGEREPSGRTGGGEEGEMLQKKKLAVMT